MPAFAQKKLQVFVSSTYLDLKEERQAAVSAILSAGHIPAGMELFAAGDESQMVAIEQWIDESDIFMLILGGRYGAIDPKSGKSYTHLEYEYALKIKKPHFVCVINDSAIQAKMKRHQDKGEDPREMTEQKSPENLKTFRSEVLNSKLVKPWDDEKDIKIAVGESMGNFARQEDLVGWVRPTEQGNVAAHADEIARLSKENAELRAKSVSTDILGMSYEEMQEYLGAKGLLDLFVDPEKDWSTGVSGDSEAERLTAMDLRALGLVEWNTNSYKLTQPGYVFLNQYRLRDLAADGEQDREDWLEGEYRENRPPLDFLDQRQNDKPQ